MKTLLTTLNAKYIHTSLALRWLYVASKDSHDIDFKEYTIKDLKKIEIAMDLYSGELIMMGEVDVKKVFKSKKTFFQRIKDIF